MAHKATLPQPLFAHARPAKPMSDADRLFWRRFLIGLAVIVAMAAAIYFGPFLLSAAIALGLSDGWDMPIDYD